jgi:predicted  nucleic acid-binding Zn-ribbon protein
MTDPRREIHLLVSIAKLDAALNSSRVEAGHLPEKIGAIEKKLRDAERSVEEADAHLESMKKERRLLEQKLQDSEEKIRKFKIQLMEIKTNKEYQAMLHEIGHMEKTAGDTEERLLIIMDELDRQDTQTADFRKKKDEEKRVMTAEKTQLEARLEHLTSEIARLEGEKPKVLTELDPAIRKRYDRILAKLHDFAVTNVAGDVCQGCHSRIPPQAVLEVKKNDQIIACQACGRLLVHYEA